MNKHRCYVAKNRNGLYYFHTDACGNTLGTTVFSSAVVFDFKLDSNSALETMQYLANQVESAKWTFHPVTIGEAVDLAMIVDENLMEIRSTVLDRLSPIERKALGFG